MNRPRLAPLKAGQWYLIQQYADHAPRFMRYVKASYRGHGRFDNPNGFHLGTTQLQFRSADVARNAVQRPATELEVAAILKGELA